MSWKHGGKGPRGYHHGDLREDLVRAALELIKEKGPAGFTFADAARWAGVSPAAPYRHFRDRDELMVDVAKRGFQLFSERLKAAWGEGKPSTADAFKRIGAAYLNFARTEPAYYAAMFESGVAIGNDPVAAVAGADCVVTDTWVSMGDKDADRRKALLKPFAVDEALMQRAAKSAIFMHCLPAYRGHEVTEDVLEGPQSVVFDEAENRLHAQKAILAWCLGAF